MRKRITMGTAAALSLTLAGTASADAGIPVQSLTGDWSASNSTVHKTPEGVHFGTYANGAEIGGSMLYKGANGLTLSDVDETRREALWQKVTAAHESWLAKQT